MPPLLSFIPRQLVSVADTWEHHGDRLAGLGYQSLASVPGDGSLTVAAIRGCAAPAAAATEEIGTRLRALAFRLRQFTTATAVTDHNVAVGIRALPER